MATKEITKSKTAQAKVGTVITPSKEHTDAIKYGGFDFDAFMDLKRLAMDKREEAWNAIAQQFGYPGIEALHKAGVRVLLNSQNGTATLKTQGEALED